MKVNNNNKDPLQADSYQEDLFIVSPQVLKQLRSPSLSKVDGFCNSHDLTLSSSNSHETNSGTDMKEMGSADNLQLLADVLVRLFRKFIKLELHLSSLTLMSNDIHQLTLRSLQKNTKFQKKEDKDLTTREIGLLLIKDDVSNRLKEIASLALANGPLSGEIGCGIYILNLWREIDSLEIS